MPKGRPKKVREPEKVEEPVKTEEPVKSEEIKADTADLKERVEKVQEAVEKVDAGIKASDVPNSLSQHPRTDNCIAPADHEKWLKIVRETRIERFRDFWLMCQKLPVRYGFSGSKKELTNQTMAFLFEKVIDFLGGIEIRGRSTNPGGQMFWGTMRWVVIREITKHKELDTRIIAFKAENDREPATDERQAMAAEVLRLVEKMPTR